MFLNTIKIISPNQIKLNNISYYKINYTNQYSLYYTYKQLNNLLKSQTQIEYLSDSTNFQNENDQIDFTKYNQQNEFIIYSYITDHFPTLINILKSNNIKYTLLSDEFDTDFIII